MLAPDRRWCAPALALALVAGTPAAAENPLARFDGRPVVLVEVVARVGIAAIDATRAVHWRLPTLFNHMPGRIGYKVGYSCASCAARIAKE